MLYYLGISETLDDIGAPDDGPFSGEVDTVRPCDDETGAASIEIAYEGTYDAEDDVGHLEGAGVLDFLGCLVFLESEASIVLDGDPGVDVEWEVDVDPDRIVYDVSFDGGIEFETSDERSGRCAADFTMRVEESEDGEVDISGSVCGVNASEFEQFFLP